MTRPTTTILVFLFSFEYLSLCILLMIIRINFILCLRKSGNRSIVQFLLTTTQYGDIFCLLNNYVISLNLINTYKTHKKQQ